MPRVAVFGLFLLSFPLYASSLDSALSVDQYLEQVTAHNGAVRGALESSQGAKGRIAEGGLLFSTALFGNAQVIDDKRYTLVPSSQGDENKVKTAELGIAQVTRFGLAGKISFVGSRVELMNVNPMVIQNPLYSEFGPKLELTFPLWQNLWGTQYRHIEEAQNAAAGAVSYAKEYEYQALRLDAEVRYWKLAAIRASIGLIEKNVVRTQEILTFNKKKYSKRLADINDVLQAQAVLKARELDLKIAKNEEREAIRSFNAARHVDSVIVEEQVSLPQAEQVMDQLKAVRPALAVRYDVKAAEQQWMAVRASAEVSRDKTRPDVSLFGSALLFGRDPQTSVAFSHAFNVDHPYYIAGIKFTLPMDFGSRSEIRDAYAKEEAGAELSFQQKSFDQGVDLKNLHERLSDLSVRLDLAEQVRAAQLAKLQNERERQQQGKSSTFQVFAFEQEYLGALLGLVQVRSAALASLAQLKLYVNR